jgi:hypothetical protein
VFENPSSWWTFVFYFGLFVRVLLPCVVVVVVVVNALAIRMMSYKYFLAFVLAILYFLNSARISFSNTDVRRTQESRELSLTKPQ